MQLRDRKLARYSPQYGPRIILHHVANQNPESRKRTGQRGDDYPRDVESFGERARVQTSGAAERHQGEVSRVASAFD